MCVAIWMAVSTRFSQPRSEIAGRFDPILAKENRQTLFVMLMISYFSITYGRSAYDFFVSKFFFT